jgi:hypothetical protein
MKKQLQIFSFALAMMSSINAFDELTLFDEADQKSKWALVEKKFITDVYKYKKIVWEYVSASALAVTAVFAGHQYLAIPTGSENDFINTLRQQKNVYSMLGLGSAAMLVNQGLDAYLTTRANRNAVAEFFGNWDQNQFYTPTELEDAFDIIAEMMELQGQEAVLENANEIVDTIHFIVMRHFDGRYKSILEAKSRDALADTKTISEAFKNLFDGAKNMSGTGK